jgi:hypothetical protein
MPHSGKPLKGNQNIRNVKRKIERGKGRTKEGKALLCVSVLTQNGHEVPLPCNVANAHEHVVFPPVSVRTRVPIPYLLDRFEFLIRIWNNEMSPFLDTGCLCFPPRLADFVKLVVAKSRQKFVARGRISQGR